MKRKPWLAARIESTRLPPLLLILIGAHLLNPVFGLAIAEREPFHGLIYERHICAGFGLLCAQSTLLGLWAALEENRWLARLAPALLLLALAAIAPALLHGDYVTVRFILLPFVGMLLFTPLRWCGLRLRRLEQTTEETRGPVQFSLLQLQCLMVGLAVMIGINGPALMQDQYDLTRFDYQLTGFTMAYTLFLSLVVCVDSSRGMPALLLRTAGFLGLAALPFWEASVFRTLPEYGLLLTTVLVPLHAAQCVVVLLSLLVLQAAGYEFDRLPRRLPVYQPADTASLEAEVSSPT